LAGLEMGSSSSSRHFDPAISWWRTISAPISGRPSAAPSGLWAPSSFTCRPTAPTSTRSSRFLPTQASHAKGRRENRPSDLAQNQPPPRPVHSKRMRKLHTKRRICFKLKETDSSRRALDIDASLSFSGPRSRRPISLREEQRPSPLHCNEE
jgi:hypothetical protein